MLDSADQCMSPLDIANYIRKRVLKLRWIGLEDEAEELYRFLSKGEAGAIAPLDTD